MDTDEKLKVGVWLNKGTALFLTGACKEHGMVQARGRCAGEGSISELLERVATALETGAIDVAVFGEAYPFEDQDHEDDDQHIGDAK